MPADFFKGRTLLIVTKHGKEKVIGPLLQQHLGVNIQVCSTFDTDQFGTFTGEVERKNSAPDTLSLKLRTAMEQTGHTLAVGSEGSFGPHPQLPFLPADEEYLLLLDAENNFEIWGRHLSHQTNFAHQTVNDWPALRAFAEEVYFPSHKLILRSASGQIVKDIADWPTLESVAHQALRAGAVQAETDMRAMNNPTRMEVIAAATQNLVEAALAQCPACEKPGFTVTDGERGLPCAQCGQPTSAVLKFIRSCKNCAHQQEQWYPHGEVCDPQYCEYCNP